MWNRQCRDAHREYPYGVLPDGMELFMRSVALF